MRALRMFPMLALAVSAVLALTAFSVPGCTGTRAAYKAAAGPADTAYVLAEHYAALVHEAANLKDSPATPAAAVTAMQRADQLGQPVITRMKGLRDAYLATQSAADAAALQVAISDAVLKIADLVTAIRAARGGASPARASPLEAWFPAQVQA